MLKKFHLSGRNQDPGNPGVGKVRGRGFFFPSSRVGGLTLDDTMDRPARRFGKAKMKEWKKEMVVNPTLNNWVK